MSSKKILTIASLLIIFLLNTEKVYSIEPDIFIQSTVNRAAKTLGVWGVGTGCDLVLPVLGPSTIRDTAGSFVNLLGGDPYYNISTHGNNEYLDKSDYMLTKALTAVDFRAKNIETIENLEKNSLDFYASVKSLYLQDRQRKIANTNASIEIIYESDWEEIEN